METGQEGSGDLSKKEPRRKEIEKRRDEQPYSIGVRCRDCGAPMVSHGRLFHTYEAISSIPKGLIISVPINGGWYVNDWTQPCIQCGCSQILLETGQEGSGDLSKKEPKCRCCGCGKVFPASEIERGICPAEYGEDHVSYEASPCCHRDFWEDE